MLIDGHGFGRCALVAGHDVGHQQRLVVGRRGAQLAAAGVHIREVQRSGGRAPLLAAVQAQRDAGGVIHALVVVHAPGERVVLVVGLEVQIQTLLLQRLALERDRRPIGGNAGRIGDGLHPGRRDDGGDFLVAVVTADFLSSDAEVGQHHIAAHAVVDHGGPVVLSELGQRDAEAIPVVALGDAGLVLQVRRRAHQPHLDLLVHRAVRPGVLPAAAVDPHLRTEVRVQHLHLALNFEGRRHGQQRRHTEQA
eukprot:scaffold149_cov315-Pinguiococcus_pyrenoidosus.AAC.25